MFFVFFNSAKGNCLPTNLVKLDPDPHLKSCWIQFRIEKNSRIRIHKKGMQIYGTALLSK